jgi:excisionase family DNA binding protein
MSKGKKEKEMTQLSVGLEDAQAMTGISTHMWRKLVKEGKVRAARVGRRILIPTSELERITKPDAKTPGRES